MFILHTRLQSVDPACRQQIASDGSCETWDDLINLLCLSPSFNFVEFIVEVDEIDLALMDKGKDYENVE